MKKGFKYLAISWVALLGLYNVITFLWVAKTSLAAYSTAFWIGYGFISAMFVGQLLCGYAAFGKDDLQKTFYNLPLVGISVWCMVLSFVVGTICMLLPMPYWVGIVLCAIILTFTVIALSAAKAGAELVGAADAELKAQTMCIRTLTVDAERVVLRATDANIRAIAQKVYEAVRYSDPMSSEMLRDVETQITNKFYEFANAVSAGDNVKAAPLADELLILIGDRNTKCKLFK